MYTLCTHLIINWPVLIDSEVNCTCTCFANVHAVYVLYMYMLCVHVLYMYMFCKCTCCICLVHVYVVCTCAVHVNVHDYTEIQTRATILSAQFDAFDFLNHFQLEAVNQLDSEMKVAVSLVFHVLQLFEINLSFPLPHCSSVVDLLV